MGSHSAFRQFRAAPLPQLGANSAQRPPTAAPRLFCPVPTLCPCSTGPRLGRARRPTRAPPPVRLAHFWARRARRARPQVHAAGRARRQHSPNTCCWRRVARHTLFGSPRAPSLAPPASSRRSLPRHAFPARNKTTSFIPARTRARSRQPVRRSCAILRAHHGTLFSTTTRCCAHRPVASAPLVHRFLDLVRAWHLPVSAAYQCRPAARVRASHNDVV